ncbi:MAG: hypothetical protein J6A58_04100 [Oscillospiraceae bacterium]|nr:hypothetical protein [Oscillospiraceae bacterium]
MKKIIYTLVLIMALHIFSGCSENKDNINYLEYKENIFDYNIENACAFTVDNGKLFVAFSDDNYINCYDANGNKIDKYDFGEGFHTNLSYYNNVLYSFNYLNTGNTITAYNIQNNTMQEYSIQTDISSVIAMTVLENKIYMVYWSENSDEYLESIKYSVDDNYIYMGEKAIVIDIENFETEEIPINNVINLKPYSKNEIIYYAYDDIGGYYFTIYNIDKKSFSEKKYNNIPKYTYSFDFYDNNIIYSDFGNRKITSVNIDNNESVIDFIPNVVTVSGNDLKIENGFCYVLDNHTRSIIRVKYNETIKENKEIKFLSSEIYSEVPYGCGYLINTNIIGDDEFALNILAENSEYDICMMSSAQQFSKNIRDKGAFCKLNEIPMVKEYLDKCFPYLKDAATDKNGDIWMIPIAVDIPCIVYNPENCKKNNIELNSSTTWSELFEICSETSKNHALRNKFSVNGYQAQSDIINRYNLFHSIKNGKAVYNNDLFKKYCNLLKDTNIDSDFLHTRIISMDHYDNLNDYYGDYLFELLPYSFSTFYKETFENLRAIPTPSINGEEKSCAECIYFCVNSNSDNLDDTLNYISSYCSYMMKRVDAYIFEDKNIYLFNDMNLANDLYDIYSNAEVSFSPSNEMFWNDYIEYIQNKISVDELAEEVERKTNMYMDE